ncbi:hypothetical protein RJ639_036723 [Escallonia herrerae]|uniref:Poly(A) RNA polymerase mitochondrial-like central palm domain-containing protein n=1 Tax=Escallonia herrerae TaxID=1293975 RepID=A0AA88WQZ3_9ASTE|nr:hypothetical protein RJ639_036723 [Escallonia herrerae]
MNANNLLELTLRDILNVINPSRDDWSIRFRIIEELRDVIQSIESLRVLDVRVQQLRDRCMQVKIDFEIGRLQAEAKELVAVAGAELHSDLCNRDTATTRTTLVREWESQNCATVEPYGSFVSNLFTRWGDLDISIEIANGSYISIPGKKLKQSLLRDVQRALRRRGRFHNLLLVANARVPVLKFQTNWLNLSCDVSINNLIGQMKSKMLFWINEIDGRFRDMVLLVKEWAKAHDINDSTSGTLNSYSLSLLIIFHLQTCVPAILPPLKEIYPGNMIHDLTGVRAVAEKHIEEVCAVNINRFRAQRSRVINRSSVSQLFLSFLAKYSDISLTASEQGISPHSGRWEDIEGNMTWLPRTYALFVEDPFEQPVNTARSVSSRQLTNISETFRRTHNMLISANQTQTSIIATLVREEVSRSLARALQVSNPNVPVGDSFRTRLQVNSVAHSPAQVQHQFQNLRTERHPNNVTTNRPLPAAHDMRMNGHPNNVTPIRPLQAVHSQGQQIWRPRSDS